MTWSSDVCSSDLTVKVVLKHEGISSATSVTMEEFMGNMADEAEK